MDKLEEYFQKGLEALKEKERKEKRQEEEKYWKEFDASQEKWVSHPDSLSC